MMRHIFLPGLVRIEYISVIQYVTTQKISINLAANDILTVKTSL